MVQWDSFDVVSEMKRTSILMNITLDNSATLQQTKNPQAQRYIKL